jgi:glutamate-1-semialdehyde 2,1-aminomutase
MTRGISFADIKRKYESAYRMRTPKSLAILEAARRYMPGGESRASIWYSPYPLWCDRADGFTIVDLDGNEYIDFHNCYTAMVLGHAHPKVTQAIKEQLKKGPTGMGAASPNLIRWAELICKRIESIDKIRFANSGTEAVMMAIRVARGLTGKDKILKTEWGYHGFYDPVEYPSEKCGLPKSVFRDSISVPFNDKKAVEKAIVENKDDLAAMILEGQLGTGGQIPPRDGYLGFVREVTAAYGVFLILDEIQSLRYHYGGMQSLFGIKPDITTFGKLIGGGLPVGAFGGREDVMQQLSPETRKIYHSGTFNGNPLTAVAGIATLEQFTGEEITRINKLGDTLAQRIRNVFAKFNVKGQVTGFGSVQCMHFSPEPVIDGRTAHMANKDILQLIHLSLLQRGIFLPVKCQFVISTPMKEREIGRAAMAVEETMAELLPYVERLWPELLA